MKPLLNQYLLFWVATGLIWVNVASARGIRPQQRVVRIGGVEDVISNWNPDQHLYIKGDIGVSDSDLSNLEKWLGENGLHWTIVINERSDDESYRAFDGREFFGMDAVEMALGSDLAKRTEFGSLVNGVTGEASGVVLVIFMKERKLSFFSSETYDRRGLGESAWIGDLDREAIRAMRSGGRVVEAVKNTVLSIEGRLKKQLEAEVKSGRYQQAEAPPSEIEIKRDLNSIENSLESMDAELLPRVRASAAEIRNAFPEANQSEMANPPLAAWTEQISDLRQSIAGLKDEISAPTATGRIRELNQSKAKIRGEIEKFLDLYAAHKSLEQILAPIEEELAGIGHLSDSESNAASEEATRLLTDAREARARGDSSFIEKTNQAKQLATQASQTAELERLNQKKQEERRSIIRWTLTISGSLLATLILFILYVLNRRRLPAKRRAEQLFQDCRSQIEAGTASVGEITRDAEQVLGWMGTFRQKGFEGRTLEAGNRIFANIEILKKMLSESDRVVESTSQMIHPSSSVQEAINLFGISSYEECISFLTGDHVRIPAKENLENKDSDAEQPSTSLVNFLTTMNQKAEETRQSVDSFERDLSTVDQQLSDVQSQLTRIVELDLELAEGNQSVADFDIPVLHDRFIPVIQEELATAISLAKKDPVFVVHENIPALKQKLDQALEITQILGESARDKLPVLESDRRQLDENKYDVRWIDERLYEIAETANELIGASIHDCVHDQIGEFKSKIDDLSQRATKSVELTFQIKNQIEPDLEKVSREIREAKSELAASLNLPNEQILTEEGYTPSAELDQAREQLSSARAALDYGGVESALESIEILQLETETARNLIRESIAASQRFGQEKQRLAGVADEIEKQDPELEAKVNSTQPRYAASAMEFQRGKITKSASDWLRTSREQIASTKESLDESELHFRQGRILQADGVLHVVDQELQELAGLHTEIIGHCDLLDSQMDENKSRMQKLVTAIQESESSILDRRTTMDSVNYWQDIRGQAVDFDRLLMQASTSRDPFQDDTHLQVLENRLDALRGMLDADLNSYAEADNAIRGAADVLAAANQSVTRSINDQIADSTTIRRCQDTIRSLASDFEILQQRFHRDHEDWPTIDEEADRVTSELAIVDGELRRELDLAQQAVRELRDGSSHVMSAASWHGSYGVRVVGNPGSSELEQARRYLAEGEYSSVIQLSRRAGYNARTALESAKREVVTRQQQAARREAAERRRRRNRNVIIGGGATRGWQSSRRRVSRPTRRSSGKGAGGFRRSGW